MLRFPLAVILLLLSVGCGDPVPAPESVARDVVAALARKPPLNNLKLIYERLSEKTRAELKSRAVKLRETTGVESLNDWDVIGPRFLVIGDRVAAAELLEEGDGKAKVELKLAPYVAPSGGGDDSAAKSVIVDLVMEEGQWRVELPFVPAS